MNPRIQFPDFKATEEGAEAMMKALPTIAGNMALQYIDDRFRFGGYADRRFKRWNARKVPDAGRRLLVKTGNLRRSFRSKARGMQVTVSTNVPYAQIHNEGGRISRTVNRRAHTRRLAGGRRVKVRSHTARLNTSIPQRQFMPTPNGPPPQLLVKRLELHIERTLEKIISNAP